MYVLFKCDNLPLTDIDWSKPKILILKENMNSKYQFKLLSEQDKQDYYA